MHYTDDVHIYGVFRRLYMHVIHTWASGLKQMSNVRFEILTLVKMSMLVF